MKRLMILAALTGCATSYESATSHQTLGGGSYLVTADGNGWTGASTIEHYKYRRAAELCPGGFDVIDSNQSTRTNLATFDGGKTYNTINKPSGSLAIRCRMPVQPARPTPAKRGWWCTIVDERRSVCERELLGCKDRRARAKQSDLPSADCEHRAEAVCFGAYFGPTHESVQTCFSSFDDCAAGRSAFDADKNFTLEGDCRVIE